MDKNNYNNNINNMDSILEQKQQLAEFYLQSRGLEVKKENGQRIVYPIDYLAEDLDFPKGTEVFIGRIPRDVFEDELLPIFESAGQIYKFRLMMDFSGFNRGFGFAQYTNRAAALNAINLLDQKEIRPKEFIGVVESIDNCKLSIDNLPPTVTAEQIKQQLMKDTLGVKDVIVPSTGQQSNRIHAIVEYHTHRDATMARRYLVPNDYTMFDRKIKVDWAKPQAPQENKSLKSNTLLICNVSRSYPIECLERVFSLEGMYPLNKLERLTPTSVLVTYKSRQHAADFYETVNHHKHIFNIIADAPHLSVTATWATPEFYKNLLYQSHFYQINNLGHMRFSCIDANNNNNNKKSILF